ncbi:MAG: hypothetical protein KKD44_24620 [Proteobacteria bacterium]|nr:hypothetical protein [Pseudomonadota bacterium]
MVIFEGKYEWDGKKRGAGMPISWWPGSYQIKLVNLQDRMPGVAIIKPYVCILTETGDGFSIKNTFEKFALSVCEHFNIDVEKVLWIEGSPRNPEQGAAVVKPVSHMGKTPVYGTSWRPVRPNEMTLVESCLTEH